jgi:hypothetical protein
VRDLTVAWLTAYYQRVKQLPDLKAELRKLGTRIQPKAQSTATHRLMLEMIGSQHGIALVKRPRSTTKGGARGK